MRLRPYRVWLNRRGMSTMASAHWTYRSARRAVDEFVGDLYRLSHEPGGAAIINESAEAKIANLRSGVREHWTFDMGPLVPWHRPVLSAKTSWSRT